MKYPDIAITIDADFATDVFSDEEIEMLCDACKLHTTTLRTGSVTIDTCFDADRLDIGRVGLCPDPLKMATDGGRYFI